MLRTMNAALIGVLAVALIGCGPAGSMQPTSSPTQTPVARASGDLPLPSAGAVSDLEALIPDQIAGLTILKQSMKGSDMIASTDTSAASRKFVEDLGVAPDQVSIAIGLGFSSDGSSGVLVFVFRAIGAGHDKLVSVFKEANDASRDTPLVWTSQSLGGKQVEVTNDPDAGQTIYLYATNDLLFEFSVNDADAAAQLIASLP